MAIMEELDESWVQLEKLDDQEQPLARQAALIALNQAHSLRVNGFTNGSVHGDARDPNVMVRRPLSSSSSLVEVGSKNIKFVDFDWAGEHGVSQYPMLMSRRVNWAPGAEDQGVMMQDHDVHLLTAGPHLSMFENYSWEHREQT